MKRDNQRVDRDLLDRARSEMGPSRAQRKALKRDIVAAISATAVAGTAAGAHAAAAAKTGIGGALGASAVGATTSGVLVKWSVALVIVGVGAVGISMAPRSGRDTQSNRAHVAAPASAPEAVPTSVPAPVAVPEISAPQILAPQILAPQILAPQILAPEVVTAPIVAPRRATPPSMPAIEAMPTAPVVVVEAPPAVVIAPESLAAETALLRDVHAALGRGAPNEAMSLLDRHAREFPHGLLVEERAASRALALCASGALGEGQAEVDRFAQAHPRSPQLERLRRACTSQR